MEWEWRPLRLLEVRFWAEWSELRKSWNCGVIWKEEWEPMLFIEERVRAECWIREEKWEPLYYLNLEWGGLAHHVGEFKRRASESGLMWKEEKESGRLMEEIVKTFSLHEESKQSPDTEDLQTNSEMWHNLAERSEQRNCMKETSCASAWLDNRKCVRGKDWFFKCTKTDAFGSVAVPCASLSYIRGIWRAWINRANFGEPRWLFEILEIVGYFLDILTPFREDSHGGALSEPTSLLKTDADLL